MLRCEVFLTSSAPLRDKSLIRRKKMLLSSPPSSLIFYSLLLFPTQRWSLCTATKPNPQCLLSALSPTYALSISPSPVAIIHQIRNGVEKTARRIVDPLNTRGGRDGGGMYRRYRQLHVGSPFLSCLTKLKCLDVAMVLMLPTIFESAVIGLLWR